MAGPRAGGHRVSRRWCRRGLTPESRSLENRAKVQQEGPHHLRVHEAGWPGEGVEGAVSQGVGDTASQGMGDTASQGVRDTASQGVRDTAQVARVAAPASPPSESPAGTGFIYATLQSLRATTAAVWRFVGGLSGHGRVSASPVCMCV